MAEAWTTMMFGLASFGGWWTLDGESGVKREKRFGGCRFEPKPRPMAPVPAAAFQLVGRTGCAAALISHPTSISTAACAARSMAPSVSSCSRLSRCQSISLRCESNSRRVRCFCSIFIVHHAQFIQGRAIACPSVFTRRSKSTDYGSST